jgi:hypothetical protein
MFQRLSHGNTGYLAISLSRYLVWLLAAGHRPTSAQAA